MRNLEKHGYADEAMPHDALAKGKYGADLQSSAPVARRRPTRSVSKGKYVEPR
jgi:hypothetical protein